MEHTFYSHGKLLLSSEYVVLDGATALAIPTKKGQSLTVKQNSKQNNCIHWSSFTDKGVCWYEDTLQISKHGIHSISGSKISKTLCEILEAAKKLNPIFLTEVTERTVETHLEFRKEWGLGSSSTLINNIAQWAAVDAFQLLFTSFKGSGYDIAAAQTETAFLYQLNKEVPTIIPSPLSWSFTDQLFFVHLNKKQDSKEGILQYKARGTEKQINSNSFSAISEAMVASKSIEELSDLIIIHEKAISGIIGLKTVKERLFSDYNGAIKSLGAWGGDFVMVTGNVEDMNYFKGKGYQTIIPFSNMCL